MLDAPKFQQINGGYGVSSRDQSASSPLLLDLSSACTDSITLTLLWLPTALGLLVTGMVAQGYGLYCSIKRVQQLNSR